MGRKIKLIGSFVILLAGAIVMMGATPLQKGVPPQPFNADYFSGTVYLGSDPAPAGIQLVGCVGECDLFQTEVITLDDSSAFNLLAIQPKDRRLRGREVTFYIVNQYGRIRAAETAFFEGGFNATTLDLHFYDPLPLPPAPAKLPQVGDPIIPNLPRLALAVGTLAMAAGLWSLTRHRRAVRYLR